MKLLNAVSLSMFTGIGGAFNLKAEMIPLDTAKYLLEKHGLESCIGHQDAATMLSMMLKREVPMNRISTSLSANENAIVFQYMGPRLPEGSTALPPDSQVAFFLITVSESTGYCYYCGNGKGVYKGPLCKGGMVGAPLFICPTCAEASDVVRNGWHLEPIPVQTEKP